MLPRVTQDYPRLHAGKGACMQFLSLSEQLTRISQCLLVMHSWEAKLMEIESILSSHLCLGRIFKSLFSASATLPHRVIDLLLLPP